MEKKILFFDIDGTLLTDEKKVLPSTKAALKQLQANGHEVAIATGRNYTMAKTVIDELELQNYIVCNGAAGFFHNELVYENVLDPTEFERMLQLADKEGHQVVYETPFKLRRRSEAISIRIKTAMEAVGFGVPKWDDEFYKEHKMSQALIFYREEEKDIYENGQFSKLKFVRWHDTGVDVLPRDGSKAATILEFSANQGFKREDIIAFGDGLNDLEMISQVGVGVAMGNALESIKLRADKVTANNNEDGIAIALKEMGLI
ncbi:Cof-type HAD-IIB family hydrolase [Desemzia incerta]|uniref:Cof-type HAD-IIB family hydrolase n=1 Tax=Desemzia incerta TaxID=82801 RepID=UPI0024C268B6|nr:Cof-type HAD-IIB family hydrolase [Desemzia incerta]WHZ31487.1 Cof-type HAD-IIB family hydrolase [Desemzia incerta]